MKLRAIARPSAPDVASALAMPANGKAALGAQLEDIERDAIVKTLEKTRYNKTAAAKLLGTSFRALRYRVKKLAIGIGVSLGGMWDLSHLPTRL